MTDLVLENEFYSKKFYFSYSGLNKLLFSPTVFYKHYVLNQREDKTDAHLIEGKLLHCLLLDEASFEDQFIMMPGSVPTGPTKIVLDSVYRKAVELNLDLNLSKLDSHILDVMTSVNFHQRLKTDQQRLDKIITDDNISYFEFLGTKKNKDIIDQETLDKIKSYVDIITSNKAIMNTLQGDGVDSSFVSETFLKLDIDKYSFGIKGIVDRIVYHKDFVHVIDFKTTNKTISEFEDTVEFYNYWLQAAIYVTLVSSYIGRQTKFSFIVIDKYQQLYEFEVSETTMENWISRMNEMFAVASYHYDNREYTLPYKFATTKVVL